MWVSNRWCVSGARVPTVVLKTKNNLMLFAAEVCRSRGWQLGSALWALLSKSKCIQYYQKNRFKKFGLPSVWFLLISNFFMATHIMLSFSTQIAQHTEEHPPTPWRVGPCNQVTGGAGMCGGGGVPPTRGLCGAKVFQNILQALDINTNGEKRVVWFRKFIDGLTAKL